MKSHLLQTIKLTVLLVICMMAASTVHAQVIKQESFDSLTFQPAGWSLDPAGANPIWVRRTTGPNGANILPHTGAAMARYTVTNIVVGTQQSLITPVIDYSYTNGATPTFSMWMYRDSLSTSPDSITVLVNTSATAVGATRLGVVARSRYSVLPTNELVNGWYNYSFNIPSTFNTATNYIILRGTAQGGSNMFVDDVEWDEYPTPCSGQPTAGSVTASTDTICGGSGSSDLTLIGSSASLTGIVYTWQNSAAATGPWTDFGASTVTENTGTITTTTFYRCLVTCTASGLVDSTAALEITVITNPLPTITVTPSGPYVYCVGSSPLSLTANGADTYGWTPGTGLNTTSGATVLANPTNQTTYTVAGRDLFGCSATTTINVNVSNPPNFIASVNRSSVCAGDTTVLRAINQGGPGFGTQYVWNPGSLVGNNVIITVNTPTTYTVVGTNQAGCTKADSVSVSIATGVNPNFAYTSTGLSVVFTDNSNGAVSWAWLFGDGNGSSSQNPTYSYSNPGTYNVSLVVSNGICSPDTIIQTITVTTIGLAGVEGNIKTDLFPNPASETSILVFNSTSKHADIAIVNALGKVVFEKSISPVEGNTFSESLDLKALSIGVYFVKVTTEDDSGVHRLVKQ